MKAEYSQGQTLDRLLRMLKEKVRIAAVDNHLNALETWKYKQSNTHLSCRPTSKYTDCTKSVFSDPQPHFTIIILKSWNYGAL